MSTEPTSPAKPSKPDPKAAAVIAEVKKLTDEKAEIARKKTALEAREAVVDRQLAALAE